MIEQIQNSLSKVWLNNVSMASVQQSSVESVQYLTCYSIQCSWTSFAAGGNETIVTYASNDGNIWSAVDSFIPSGTTGNRMLNVEKCGYRFIKVIYTPNSSSGTLLVTVSGKVV